MEETQTVILEFDKQLLWRGRLLRFMTIVLALYAASMGGLVTQALLERTDWADIFPGQLLLSAVIALVVTPVLGVVYMVTWIALRCCCKVRHLPPSVRIATYLIPGVIPALMILVPLVFTAMDRLSPGRIFENLTGHELPENSVVTHYTNTSDFIESHLSIEFRASDTELRALLDDMGFHGLHSRGKQEFSPVQLKGDWGHITVDWDHHIAIFEYLDV